MRLLVTGGTGTFGRAMIRRATQPGQPWTAVRSVSRHEVKVAALHEEFGHLPPFKAMLGDVRNTDTMAMALRGVDTLVHAAALKRVDVGAYSPSEMIITNILGTMNVVSAAIEARVRAVVVISSDKAVNAINIYGKTKACAEDYAVQANVYGHGSGTRISAVRYGNILGSTGSVVRIWREQVARGLPLTLTDRRMTRFVMTIEQAVALVEHAIRAMRGGEVFVPVLPSAYMLDLARAVAPSADYPLQDTFVRPGGEKLAESLLNEEEPTRTVLSGPHYAILPTHHEWTARNEWQGTPVDPHLSYRSDRNDRWLDADGLRALIAATEACR